MKPNLFRPAALNAVAPPDACGEILRVTAPKDWAVFAGAFVLMASAATWSWFGHVTRTAGGRAVVVRSGGVVSVNSNGSGQIVELNVKPGDAIRVNQVIARISNPMLAGQVRLAEDALAEARREAERTVSLRSDVAALKTAAIERQKGTLNREIASLEEQARSAAERVAMQEQLWSEKLATKQGLVDAREKAAGIQNEIARHHAEIEVLDADRFALQATPRDTSAEASERVAELARRLDSLRQELQETTLIKSPSSGEAVEVKTYLGASPTVGSPLITIQPAQGTLEALAYIPSSQAKLVRPGMEAMLLPNGVSPEEYGYVHATVVALSDFPLTPTALTRRFENESLTAAIMTNGPVTEVTLKLDPDDTGAGGYRWSSGKSPMKLSSGTLCGVAIVTRRQRPISLIAPWLEERHFIP